MTENGKTINDTDLVKFDFLTSPNFKVFMKMMSQQRQIIKGNRNLLILKATSSRLLVTGISMMESCLGLAKSNIRMEITTKGSSKMGKSLDMGN